MKRFDIYLIRLDPTVGSEVRKVRPCVIVSPDDLNNVLNTVIVAPMTTARKHYKLRVQYRLRRTQGEIMIDQLRAVDKSRLTQQVGKISADKCEEILSKLREMFS